MKSLSRKAQIYIITIILAGIGGISWELTRIDWQNWPWLLGLTALASAALILKIEGSTHESSYSLSWLVYGFTYLLLGAPATVLVITVAHLVEWARHRYPWYIQIFNIANNSLSITVAGLIGLMIAPAGIPIPAWTAISLFTALILFTLSNHFLTGLVILFARGQSFKQSGVFGWMTIMMDLAIIGTGAGAAFIWMVNPIGALLSLLPLYLIYNTLKIPALKRESESDPKTKLFNAKYFITATEAELERADRYDRPLTLVMGDLDLLRNINNTYGHLAGDLVLIEVARILKTMVAEKGVVARFGGEEFSILLPEHTLEQAYPLVEAIRLEVEAAKIEVSTSVTPIQATISFGIATRERKGELVSDLIHDADVALYHSKTKGRNQSSIVAKNSYMSMFNENSEPVPALSMEDLASRVEHARARPAPEAPREILAEHARQKQTEFIPQDLPDSPQPKPAWMLNSFIGLLAVAALFLSYLVALQNSIPANFLALMGFAAAIVLTEVYAIEIYYRDTSISTSAIILLSGTFIFGIYGAFVLSLTLALTAKILNRSEFKRFLFNASNHLFYSAAISGMVMLSIGQISANPLLINLSYCIFLSALAYLGNTGAVATAVGLSMGRSIRKIWKQDFLWLLPFYVAYGIVAYAIVVAYTLIGVAGLGIILVPIWMLRLSQLQYVKQTKTYVETVRRNHHALELQSLEISELNRELLVILADIVDMRDPYTHGHSLQVNNYAVRIGEELGLNADQIDRVEKASLLHDIGKLGIPEEILFKPGRLTGEEFEFIKEHPVFGAKIISKAHPLSDLAMIIRHHHERFDGNGYPDGLQGEEIPLEARIITLADSIEAMASDRPYRQGMDFPAILAEVLRGSGSQFDPAVVQAFLNLLNKEPNLLTLSCANSVSEAFHLRMNLELKVPVRRNNEGPEATAE